MRRDVDSRGESATQVAHPMPPQLTPSAVATIGIDIGKNTLHLVGLDQRGGAWLGLVPRQESTGDRTILGKISKRVTSTCEHCSCRLPMSSPPTELGKARSMALDRAGIEAAPPQHAGDRTGQQAGSYRLGRARPRSRISADDHAPHGVALTKRGQLNIFPAEVCEIE